MMDLRELYQEIILDHNRDPHNHRVIANASSQANGFNPVCGDKLTVYLSINNHAIQDVSFMGCGCAISQASASLMTDVMAGKTIDEAHHLFERFHQMLTGEENAASPQMDKLAVLAGVRAFPARVKCATLAWHTLEAALKKDQLLVTTE